MKSGLNLTYWSNAPQHIYALCKIEFSQNVTKCIADGTNFQCTTFWKSMT